MTATISAKTFEYHHGTIILHGHLVYDTASKEKRPAIILVHDWMGVGEQAKDTAERLAKLGYIAFAADIYGKEHMPKNIEEAIAQATKYRGDRSLMRARAAAALDEIKKHPLVDPKKIAVIGFCFGGGVALELARSGADVAGVISFHGNLDTPNDSDAKHIKAKVLVLHGADDPFVPKEQVDSFVKEMRDAHVDWELIMYGGAVHAFTNHHAGNDNAKGAAYNKKADERSWDASQQFYNEIFK